MSALPQKQTSRTANAMSALCGHSGEKQYLLHRSDDSLLSFGFLLRLQFEG